MGYYCYEMTEPDFLPRFLDPGIDRHLSPVNLRSSVLRESEILPHAYVTPHRGLSAQTTMQSLSRFYPGARLHQPRLYKETKCIDKYAFVCMSFFQKKFTNHMIRLFLLKKEVQAMWLEHSPLTVSS